MSAYSSAERTLISLLSQESSLGGGREEGDKLLVQGRREGGREEGLVLKLMTILLLSSWASVRYRRLCTRSVVQKGWIRTSWENERSGRARKQSCSRENEGNAGGSSESSRPVESS